MHHSRLWSRLGERVIQYGLVYNAGIVNIAADNAEDGDQGYLSKKFIVHIPYTFKSPSGTDTCGLLWIKPAKQTRFVEYNGNLRRRGWVFQEYNLSGRTLRYNTYGLIWECRNACLFASDVLFEENEWRREYRALKNFTLLLSVNPRPPNWELEVYTTWRKLVTDYSRKELTYAEDILPALSGLASLVQKAVHGQYLAGIWRRDLPRALQWVPEKDFSWRSIDPYLVPSWSWASRKITYPIVYPTSTAEFRVDILDAGTEVAGANALGRVSDGFIKLSGLVQTARFKQISPDSSALQIVFGPNNRRISGAGECVANSEAEIKMLPRLWCLLLSISSTAYSTGGNMSAYGIMILEKDRKDKTLRQFSFVKEIVDEEDWAGAVTRVLVIK